ncbi:MAG: RNA ligase family protein [Cetobacterium sp.]
MKEIKKYTDIIRYGKTSTQGVINQGDIISITEKVDGANASFTRDDENPLGVSSYSRRLALNIGNTLQGFYGWVIDNIVPMKDELITNYRYIGEWTTPHKIKYKEEYTKQFLLFSIWDDEREQYLSDEIVRCEAERLGLKTVEYFYYGEFISYEHMASFVGKSNITDIPDTGEGIVVKNVNYFDRHGKQLFVKLVSEKFAELQPQKLPKNPNIYEKEVSAIKTVLTKPRVDKLLHKLVDEDQLTREEFVIENMGKLLKLLRNIVVEDMMKEESEILKDIEGEAFMKCINKILPLTLKEVLKDYE